MDLTHLTPDEKINGIGSLKVPNYLRNKVHGQDVREIMAQLAEMIIQLGINLGLDPDDALEWARKLQESVSQSEFDSWVATLLDGGPSLFFETKAALVANYPNGAPGVALVRETDPAKIYVWNGSSWEDFGDYQGIEIADGSITSKKIANGAISANKLSIVEVTSKNKFNPESVELGILLADGTVGTSSGSTVFYTSDFMRFNPNEVVTTNLNLQSSAAYDRSGRKISVTLNTLHTQVIMPSNGYYLKVTRPEDRINEFMVVSGEMPSTYDPFRSTIDEQYIPSISGENIKDNSITTQ